MKFLYSIIIFFTCSLVLKGQDITKYFVNGTPLDSINSEDNDRELLIYPNPSNGSFVIDAEKPFNDVIITDLLGNVVYKHSGTNIASLNIKLEEKVSGLVLIQIKYVDKSITNIKHIVLK